VAPASLKPIAARNADLGGLSGLKGVALQVAVAPRVAEEVDARETVDELLALSAMTRSSVKLALLCIILAINPVPMPPVWMTRLRPRRAIAAHSCGGKAVHASIPAIGPTPAELSQQNCLKGKTGRSRNG
jgi:hypothetical protein